MTTGSVELVAQIGDRVHFRAVVANDGPGALQRVFAVGFLPSEVTFISADLLPEVEATLYQRVGSEEYITWNIGDLAAGERITLTWTAEVDSPGDMHAVNAVRAIAEGAPRIRRESSTYLATTSVLGGSNPEPRPTTTTVVSYKEVQSGSTLGAPSGDPSALPVTGFDWVFALAVGLLLVALGGLVWWAALPGPRRRRRIGLALAALALLAACTSGDDLERSAPAPTGSPEVKGRRIGPGGEVRDLGEGRGDQQEDDFTPEDATPPDDSQPTNDEPTSAPPAQEPSTTLVRIVRTVAIDPELRPPVPLASGPGDNEVSYGWDGSRLTSVASSASDRRSPVQIETTIQETRGVVRAVVNMTNTSSQGPVAVDGRLRLTLDGSGRATLVSAPLETTLLPGGDTAVSFTYDLPGGTYSATSFFTSH